MTEDIVLYDQDGYIDIEKYIQKINNHIRACCAEMDINKPDSNQINGFLRIAYRDTFKPAREEEGIKCNIPLNHENVERLIEIYRGVIETWNTLPSKDGFERLTGVKRSIAGQHVTDFDNILTNMRKTYIQNRLNNTPLGVLTLANNDIDTGLLYTRQNIVAHEVMRKSLSFEDLKRIAEQVEIPEKP